MAAAAAAPAPVVILPSVPGPVLGVPSLERVSGVLDTGGTAASGASFLASAIAASAKLETSTAVPSR